jgi:hypothetical protein
MIKKFENYINNDLNKVAIDSASVIESTTPDGDVYQHTLEFVLPYHENELIDRKVTYKGMCDMIEHKYKLTELNSNEFRFNKTMTKRMISNKIINDDFIDEETNMINPYYEFRFLGNIFDFTKTKCKCGLFKINK